MNVKELIEELNKFPDDMTVVTEGCDCIGDIGSVVKDDYFEEVCVFLMRSKLTI